MRTRPSRERLQAHSPRSASGRQAAVISAKALVLLAASCSSASAPANGREDASHGTLAADAGGRVDSGRSPGQRPSIDGSDGSTDAGFHGVDGGRMDSRARPTAEAGQDGTTLVDSGMTDTGKDAGHVDARPPVGDGGDASAVGMDAGGVATPAVVYGGRFDQTDPAGPQMAWPGTRIVARFDGTGVSVQLSQSNGFSGGPSWFDVLIDGSPGTAFNVSGAGQKISLASGLSAGTHVIELEKRTEANLGSVRFEGFTFTGGTGLLLPPPPATHRIEFLSDSTIDGFGVLGNIATTCPMGDPPQFNDSRSSTALFTASALGADMVLSAYSGKGLTVNEDPADSLHFQDLYPRAIPDVPTSVWAFATEIPDAVVFSLGGVDMDGRSTAPAGFQQAYNGLVGTVRGHYPHAAIWLTVWAQLKNDTLPTRTAMTNTLQAIVNARTAAGDSKIFLYSFPESNESTDETGCEYHANVSLSQAMGKLMASEIKTRLGW